MADNFFSGDPVPKPSKGTPAPPKKPASDPALPGGGMYKAWEQQPETPAPAPSQKPLPSVDLKQLAAAIKNTESEDDYQAPTYGSAPGFIPGNDYFRKNSKKDQLKAEEIRIQKAMTPQFEALAETLFGGDKVRGYLTKTPAGNWEPDEAKILEAADKWNTQNGGDGNTRNLITSFLKNNASARSIQQEAVFHKLKSGNYLKSVQAATKIDKELSGIAAEAELYAKNNEAVALRKRDQMVTKAKELFEGNSAAITEKYQANYQSLLDEFEDVAFNKVMQDYRTFENEQLQAMDNGQISQEIVFTNLKNKQQEINEYLDSKRWNQGKYNVDKREYAEQQFKARFEPEIEKEVAPLMAGYLESIRQANMAAKSDYERLNKASKAQLIEKIDRLGREKVEAYATRLMVERDAVARVVKEREIREKVHREVVGAFGKLPGLQGSGVGEMFSRNLLMFAGNTLKNVGQFLDLVGLQQVGADMDVSNRIAQKDLTWSNFFNPDMMAQGIGQFVGQQGPQAIATIGTLVATRNPALAAQIGGVMGTMNNIVQMKQDTYNQVIENGGTVSEATEASRKMAVTSLLMAPAEFIESGSLVKNIIGKGIGSKVLSVGKGGATEYAQETVENASQDTFVNPNSSFIDNLTRQAKSQESLQAAYSSVLFGGGSALVSRKSKTPSVPSGGALLIADMIDRKGVAMAEMVAEFEYAQGNISEDELLKAKETISEINQSLEDAKQLGLDKGQAQLFIGVSREIKLLEQQAASLRDPQLKEVAEKRIAEKKKELEQVVAGDAPTATITLPSGGSVTTTVDNAVAIIESEEGKALMGEGLINVQSDDKAVEDAKKKAVKEQPEKVEQKVTRLSDLSAELQTLQRTDMFGVKIDNPMEVDIEVTDPQSGTASKVKLRADRAQSLLKKRYTDLMRVLNCVTK